MTVRTTFASRLFTSNVLLAGRLGRKVTYAELLEALTISMGEDAPKSTSTISRWFTDGTVPDVETVRRTAQFFKVDPGWLAFGEDSAAPAPGNPAADLSEPQSPPDTKRRGRG